MLRNIVISGMLALFSSQTYADITISAVGDIMVGNKLIGVKEEPRGFFDDVVPFLRGSDISFANLEGPIGGKTPKTCSSPYCHTFSQLDNTAQLLKAVGFNLLSVANNHARDMGDSGMIQTEKSLRDANLEYAGYHSKPSATLTVKNNKVGFLAFSANRGLPDYRNTDQFAASIRDLKTTHDFVIVSMHAGCEGTSWSRPPIGEEICFGENRGDIGRAMRTAIDNGADLILGHGPHVPRGIVFYRNKIIAWSLGNFATAAGISVSGTNGLAPLLKITYDDNFKFKHYEIVSFKQSFNTGPKLDARAYAEAHIRKVTPVSIADNNQSDKRL